MAKLTVTVTVLLLSLAISVVSLEPENDIIADPDTTNPTLPESGSGPDEVIVPVNFVNFHPINRHFPRRPLMTDHRPCHHHHRGFQIPYGNDMIISGVVTDIKMIVDPFASEETIDHLSSEIDNSGEVEAEGDGSMEITVTRVKLIKRKQEGEGEREKNTLGRKIRMFLNHLV